MRKKNQLKPSTMSWSVLNTNNLVTLTEEGQLHQQKPKYDEYNLRNNELISIEQRRPTKAK